MFPGGHYGQQLLLKIFYVLKLRPHPIGLLMLVSVLMLGVRKEPPKRSIQANIVS